MPSKNQCESKWQAELCLLEVTCFSEMSVDCEQTTQCCCQNVELYIDIDCEEYILVCIMVILKPKWSCEYSYQH
jgi:hypothetical protein